MFGSFQRRLALLAFGLSVRAILPMTGAVQAQAAGPARGSCRMCRPARGGCSLGTVLGGVQALRAFRGSRRSRFRAPVGSAGLPVGWRHRGRWDWRRWDRRHRRWRYRWHRGIGGGGIGGIGGGGIGGIGGGGIGGWWHRWHRWWYRRHRWPGRWDRGSRWDRRIGGGIGGIGGGSAASVVVSAASAVAAASPYTGRHDRSGHHASTPSGVLPRLGASAAAVGRPWRHGRWPSGVWR